MGCALADTELFCISLQYHLGSNMRFNKSVILCGFSDDYGNVGFVAKDTSKAENTFASTGATFAHDMLEHINGPEHIGCISDELQALGAFWYVRAEYERMRSNHRNPCQIFAIDISNVFRDWFNGDRMQLHAGNPRDHEQDYSFNQALEYASKECKDECEDAAQEEIDSFLVGVLPLLRIGYDKAQHLYSCQGFAWELFEAVTEEASRYDNQVVEGAMYRCNFGKKPNGDAFCIIDEIYN